MGWLMPKHIHMYTFPTVWALITLVWFLFFLTSLCAALTHIAQLTPLLSGYFVVCFPLVCLSLMPLCPCKPSKPWALMHRLPYFSTALTVACREGCSLCVRARTCAIFGSVPVFSLHQRLSYGSLLGPFLLRLDHIPQDLALVGSSSVFFPAIIKTNSSTVSPSYINRQCLALDSP